MYPVLMAADHDQSVVSISAHISDALEEHHSPLTEEEEGYFASFQKKFPSFSEKVRVAALADFFSQLEKAERHKWTYILEEYLIFDLLCPRGTILVTAFLQSPRWQEWIFDLMWKRSKEQTTMALSTQCFDATLCSLFVGTLLDCSDHHFCCCFLCFLIRF